MKFHIHRWTKWSPWFQRYNLVWRRRRHCRICDKEQFELL